MKRKIARNAAADHKTRGKGRWVNGAQSIITYALLVSTVVGGQREWRNITNASADLEGSMKEVEGNREN